MDAISENFTYLEGIQNFYFASNFEALFFFELTVLRTCCIKFADFLYLLWFLRSTQSKSSMKCQNLNCLFFKLIMKFFPVLFRQIQLHSNDFWWTIIIFRQPQAGFSTCLLYHTGHLFKWLGKPKWLQLQNIIFYMELNGKKC